HCRKIARPRLGRGILSDPGGNEPQEDRRSIDQAKADKVGLLLDQFLLIRTHRASPRCQNKGFNGTVGLASCDSIKKFDYNEETAKGSQVVVDRITELLVWLLSTNSLRRMRQTVSACLSEMASF